LRINQRSVLFYSEKRVILSLASLTRQSMQWDYPHPDWRCAQF